ncbi:hypothetical protein [Naasia sp. SYSU D00057]|uniref:hypothetical protein n=1 Tax=Naasia sp. SYSU D00057 TaxID=2817380 RepID=UPI001B300794|nr:hypothetical protein [Naasia sp. SYSU D00057]
MRTLYIAGLLILDAVVLLLGAGVMASADLDKAGTVGVLASVPTLLLALPHLPVAHVELGASEEPESARQQSRRVTALLAAVLTAAGGVPLLTVAVLTHAHLDLAVAAVGISVLALLYALGLGEKVRERVQDRRAHALLRAAQYRRRGA